MKYFCKYLPVEGEIKEGDWTLAFGNLEQVDAAKLTALNHPTAGPIFRMKVKKVKLFLCSRDIQVGDKFIRNDENHTCIDKMGDDGIVSEDNMTTYSRKYCYKVIGEVSPDALGYVKEGQEYDEYKLWWTTPSYKYLGEVGDAGKLEEHFASNGFIQVCKIKGPCGHFH